MTVDTTPIPAGSGLTVDNVAQLDQRFQPPIPKYALRFDGKLITYIRGEERTRLLAPQRPEGVPDNADVAEARKLAEHWRDRWVQHVAGWNIEGRDHPLPWERFEPAPEPVDTTTDPANQPTETPGERLTRESSARAHADFTAPVSERVGPEGVPDGCIPTGPEAYWQRQDDGRWRVCVAGKTWTRAAYNDDQLREMGVPVPPYQPDPDPADSPTDHRILVFGPVSVGDKRINGDEYVDGEAGYGWACSCKASELGYASEESAEDGADRHLQWLERPYEVEGDNTPPVAAGERTGPLGLSEGDKVRHRFDPEVELVFIREDGARWLVEYSNGVRVVVVADQWEPVRVAQPEPAETLDGIVARLRGMTQLGWASDPRTVADLVHDLANEIEAATRPDPDIITVNLPAADVREWADESAVANSPKADRFLTACRAALAAAGLPQEPTEGGQP